MSDVLIKGAKMPISCVRCPCCDDSVNFCRAAKEFIPMLGKPKFCPLVEIPPHGRLIDADNLIKDIEEIKNEAVSWWMKWLVDGEPTVIESEEENERSRDI